MAQAAIHLWMTCLFLFTLSVWLFRFNFISECTSCHSVWSQAVCIYCTWWHFHCFTSCYIGFCNLSAHGHSCWVKLSQTGAPEMNHCHVYVLHCATLNINSNSSEEYEKIGIFSAVQSCCDDFWLKMTPFLFLFISLIFQFVICMSSLEILLFCDASLQELCF